MVKVGVHKVNITPEEPVFLSGYRLPLRMKNKSKGVGDPLYARIITFGTGRGTFVIAVLDFTGVRKKYVDEMRDEINRRYGIDRKKVTIAAIHTHSAPVLSEFIFNKKQSVKFINTTKTKVIEAVGAALKNAREAKIGVGYVSADLCHNRRFVCPDGKIVMVWDREAREYGLVPTGPYDPIVRIFKIDDIKGRPICLIENYACHPVTLGQYNLKISADYPGYCRKYIENNSNIPLVIHITGAAGETNPDETGHTDLKFPRRIGERLGKFIVGGIKNIKTEPIRKLRGVTQTFEFGRKDKPGKIISEIRLLKINDIVFIAVPGELVYDLGMKFREIIREKTPKTGIIAYANDYLGYIISDRIAREGAYELRSAAGVNLEKPFISAVKKGLKKLYGVGCGS